MILNMSLPSRERGLKLSSNKHLVCQCKVAPFAGAWIEIFYIGRNRLFVLSLPSRERGLKSLKDIKGWQFTESLPSRERGLKSEKIQPQVRTFRRSLRGSVD